MSSITTSISASKGVNSTLKTDSCGFLDDIWLQSVLTPVIEHDQ